ncbi:MULTISPECIES: hypothetical protein [unclassified Rhodococcus (in: high G+C Gram-positive bacteria)]|uniref:hypothetical protein n=1 Tax=unclassified Rhodococcus (in: high G+C Gram-positive bacteria) TaxID=192944 RepID=UPI0024B82D3E|nr:MULTISPECIES: hypothetical protein [unclassified Rhodococcus (in: high G+C Gram-positive bacteria)]MDI9959031.1 hypothetical protein [Rhodococcus sp. IEGM 1237]MDI9964677.1 hypothetical protein [Rhodococcus sp. IEGM 1251]MDV8126706.1 hypothetical protein [Rhodococcus sp. IEGM 1304]
MKAAEFCLRVSAQRAKLLGLNVPERLLVSTGTALSDEDYAAMVAELLAALHPSPG